MTHDIYYDSYNLNCRQGIDNTCKWKATYSSKGYYYIQNEYVNSIRNEHYLIGGVNKRMDYRYESERVKNDFLPSFQFKFKECVSPNQYIIYNQNEYLNLVYNSNRNDYTIYINTYNNINPVSNPISTSGANTRYLSWEFIPSS